MKKENPRNRKYFELNSINIDEIYLARQKAFTDAEHCNS